MENIDTAYQRFITCPYCGYVDRDSWEFQTSSCDDWECPKCLEHFCVEREIEITYSTKKQEAK